jgi:hypothetical protein
MLHIILQTAVAVFLYMTVIFVIALLQKDNSVVDIAWGPGLDGLGGLSGIFVFCFKNPLIKSDPIKLNPLRLSKGSRFKPVPHKISL